MENAFFDCKDSKDTALTIFSPSQNAYVRIKPLEPLLDIWTFRRHWWWSRQQISCFYNEIGNVRFSLHFFFHFFLFFFQIKMPYSQKPSLRFATVPYRLFFGRSTYFCHKFKLHQSTQNTTTYFIRFTKIYTSFTSLEWDNNFCKSDKISRYILG